MAGLGAALALVGLISTVVMAIGVALQFAGTVVAASFAREPGMHLREWWSALALGALASAIGFGIAFAASVPGNLLVTAGSITALVAVILSAPVSRP